MKAVNLIPAEQRDGAGSVAGRSGGAALIVLTLLAALAVLAFVYGTSEHKISSSRGELATVNAELSVARAQAGRLTPYTSFIAMADQRAREVSQLVASRFDWTHAFNELGRVLPSTAALGSLHGTVGAGGPSATAAAAPASSAAGAAPTSATPPGSTPVFALSGCAKSQSDVAETLQRLRLMDGAAEVTLQSSTKSSGGGGAGQSGGGSCPPGAPAFAAQVTFAALPTPPVTPGVAR
jgi:Tfp pilus assembly protein PilN